MSDIQNQATPTRVFLSYARGDDEPFVKRLYADLTANGLGGIAIRYKADVNY